MSTITIREVQNKDDLRTFIYLSEKLHQHRNNWVPPLYIDEQVFFDKQKNPAYQVADTILFLAFQNNKPVGKIMGIIHHEYNQMKFCRQARFFHFDCIDNNEVAKALLGSIENWAKSQGMQTLIGPFGFSEKDPQGFQIEGFEYLPVIATATNPPYLPVLLEKEGFQKLTDCIVYKIAIPDPIPAFYERIYERAMRNPHIRLLTFKNNFYKFRI